MHWSGFITGVQLKWERHGEFSSYTLLMASRAAAPFADPAAAHLPLGWLATVPGMTVYAGPTLHFALNAKLGTLLDTSA